MMMTYTSVIKQIKQIKQTLHTSPPLSRYIVRAALIEQLPEGQQSDEFLDETIRSPQFRQSLGMLVQCIVE